MTAEAEAAFRDQRDRAEALVDATAEDPLAIARTMHHLAILMRELDATIAELAKAAADLAVDADARFQQKFDHYLEEGWSSVRARNRAKYEAREDVRAAEQAKIVADYAQNTRSTVNRRLSSLQSVNRTVDAETWSGGRRRG